MHQTRNSLVDLAGVGELLDVARQKVVDGDFAGAVLLVIAILKVNTDVLRVPANLEEETSCKSKISKLFD